MVQVSLVEAEVDPGRFTIVPFPIHNPHLWAHYVPAGVTHFLRVLSPWGVTKVRRLRAGSRARSGISRVPGSRVGPNAGGRDPGERIPATAPVAGTR